MVVSAKEIRETFQVEYRAVYVALEATIDAALRRGDFKVDIGWQVPLKVERWLLDQYRDAGWSVEINNVETGINESDRMMVFEDPNGQDI